ncbi:TRAP transporter substrate-binding protein [Sporosarcina sp. P13]|uniref:TRAP transporter substrate-binding protein n=1 Tax=Sporosarcina sp. P13 TaxID=2048263 RepID=UPI001304505C|nr:TRAP transporter substrate-binding protein [Sporosarcina sp. P13]
MKSIMRTRLLGSLIVLTILLLSGCSSNANGELNDETNEKTNEVFELNVNNYTPSTHFFATEIFEPWKESVEEKTDGRVKVNVYHGGTLGDSKSVLQDVKGGVYEVATMLVPYFYDTEMFPFTIGNLPFAFPDSKSATTVLGKYADMYGDEAFKDIVYMGMAATDAYEMFSVKPIKGMEDFKGKKVRIPSKGEASMIKAWGGVPVSMPTEEIYESLQKGVIDAAIYTTSGSISYKLFEVAPNLTKMGVTTTPLIAIMNKGFYEKLPEDIKQIFDDELSPQLANLVTESYTSLLDSSYKKYEEEVQGKGEIITLTADETNKLRAAAKSRWDEWTEEATKKGYPAEEMMEDFKQLRKDEGLDSPF